MANNKKFKNKKKLERALDDNVNSTLKGDEVQSSKKRTKRSSSRKISSDNDVSWYAKNDRILKDAASINYATVLGRNLDFEHSYDFTDVVVPEGGNLINGTDYKWDHVGASGLIRLGWVPSVGRSMDNTSAVNVAARSRYTFVRHANSGHANYDSPDLMLYCLAMDSIYSMYALGVRAYGVASVFNMFNRYMPEGTLEMCGFDSNTLKGKDLPGFRAYLNKMALKIGSMCCPSRDTYTDRHVWMCSNIYSDSTDAKAQLYAYTPDSLWYYNEQVEGGGCLDPIAIGWSHDQTGYTMHCMTVDEYIEKFDAMWNAISVSEDLNIMSGDILKAYGSDNIRKVNQIDENYTVLPTFNVEVLNQMANTTWYPLTDNYLKVSQVVDPDSEHRGALIFNPKFSKHDFEVKVIKYVNSKQYRSDYTFQPFGPSTLINIIGLETSPETTMVITRNCATFTGMGEFVDMFELDSSGSEIFTHFWLAEDSDNGDGTITWLAEPPVYFVGRGAELQVHNFYRNNYNIDAGADSVAEHLGRLQHFGLHPTPLVYEIVGTNSGADVTFGVSMADIACNLDNYTVIRNDVLRRMNEAAIMNQFDIPLLGSATQINN